PAGAALLVATAATPDDASRRALGALADQVSLAFGRVTVERHDLGPRLRALLGDRPDVVLVLDAVGRLVRDSSIVVGDEFDAPMGASLGSLLHPQDRHEDTEAIDAIHRGAGREQRLRWRMTSPAGDYRPIDVVML